jgi:type II secretory pathway pseudopilin PulG
MVAVAIVGILAAIAIPVMSEYRKRSFLSEATANIQGILEAEQAFLIRFQRYTQDLPTCPPLAAPAGEKILFRLSDCPAWDPLGWRPDGSVAYQYRVYSAYNALGERAFHPSTHPIMGCGVCYGADWNTELDMDPVLMQPWVAVEAFGDTDGDGLVVSVRTNSLNQKTQIVPEGTY